MACRLCLDGYDIEEDACRKGQAELLAVTEKLNKEEGISIINITHNMDEAKYADVVYVMHKGTITLSGTPKEVFTNVDEMIEAGLDVPQSTRLLYELKKEGIKSLDEIRGIL